MFMVWFMDLGFDFGFRIQLSCYTVLILGFDIGVPVSFLGFDWFHQLRCYNFGF